MTELLPLPAFSYFLEHDTIEMQKDAIREYAKSYARENVGAKRLQTLFELWENGREHRS